MEENAPNLELFEGKNEQKAPKTKKQRLEKKLQKLGLLAVDALESIIMDEDIKPADRIAAAKLTFDMLAKANTEDSTGAGPVEVIIKGIDPAEAG